jgi:uncharacterized protein (DUF362 family)/ferredoxin
VGAEKCDQGLRRIIDLLGGIEAFVRAGGHVFIKPNFVAPFPDAVTDLTLLATVVSIVRDAGGQPVIGESSGYEFSTEHTFSALGLNEFAAAQGVTLLNLDEGEFEQVALANRPTCALQIARPALEADVIINLPRLKRHSLTRVTLGMKNLMGLLRRDSRRLIHARDIEAGIVALNRIVQPTLTIVDGMTTLSRAVYGHTESREILVGGANLGTLDPFCAGLLGIDYKTVPHIAQFAGDISRFDVVGDDPEPMYTTSGREDKLSKQLYRLVFQSMYAADRLYAALRPGQSLIPMVHYWLGIRPAIRGKDCTQCGACVKVCPVSAIDVDQRRIMPRRCMTLRCLRCVKACPENAIEVKGWRRPSQ